MLRREGRQGRAHLARLRTPALVPAGDIRAWTSPLPEARAAIPATSVRRKAVCPHCGARVPLVRDRWLLVHNEGSTEYVIPGPDRPRCPGSFLQILRPERSS